MASNSAQQPLATGSPAMDTSVPSQQQGRGKRGGRGGGRARPPRGQRGGSGWNQQSAHQGWVASQRPSGSGAFQPGAFPVLFKADEVSPNVVSCSISIDWGKVFSCVERINRVICAEGAYVKYLSYLQQTDEDAELLASYLFEAAGVLCGVQQLLHGEKAAGRLVGAFRWLQNVDFQHLRSVRHALSQIGACVDDAVGEQLVPISLSHQVLRGLRVARHLATGFRDGIPVDKHAEYFQAINHLPTSNEADPVLKHILRCRLQVWLEARGYHHIRVTENLPILTNVNPPWHNIIGAGHQASYAPLFVAAPADAAAWVKWANSFPNDWYTGSHAPRMPRDADGNRVAFVAADFMFEALPAYRTQVEEIFRRWSFTAPALEPLFHLAGSQLLATTGSPAQRSKVVDNFGVISVQSITHLPATQLSQMAVFPVEVAWLHSTHLRSKVNVATGLIQELMVKWVRGDAK